MDLAHERRHAPAAFGVEHPRTHQCQVGAGAERALARADDELYEEAARAEGSTLWLCAQHDDMRCMLWILATVSPEEEPARYCAELAELQAAFEVHAADEERRMYPVFERIPGR